MTDPTGAHLLAGMMSDLMTTIEPIFEAGKGMRAHLEEEGWSPTMAEAFAGECVMQCIRLTLSAAGGNK